MTDAALVPGRPGPLVQAVLAQDVNPAPTVMRAEPPALNLGGEDVSVARYIAKAWREIEARMTPSVAAWSVALIGAVCLGQAVAAPAQGPAVAGRWIITGAQIAPWAYPLQRGGKAEERRLVGQSVVFAAHSVAGPSPLGCAHAVWSVHDDTPDLLFEGALAEPDARGRPRDAAALARALGMTTRTVRTVETGCSEVAYHRFSPTTLVFGLNNRIYTLHPAPAGR